MKKLNTNEVIVKFDHIDFSTISLYTKDGEDVYLTWPDGDFATIDDDEEADSDCIWPDGHDSSIAAQHTFADIWGEDEGAWETEANKYLEDAGVKLGEYHSDIDAYELETI